MSADLNLDDVAAQSPLAQQQLAALRARLLEMEAAHEDGAGTVQAMQTALQEADYLMGNDDAATSWRERWNHFWPRGGHNAQSNLNPTA